MLHDFRNTGIILGRMVRVEFVHVFGSASSSTPVEVQPMVPFRLCGMVSRLFCIRTIPAMGLVNSALNRLGLLCWVIRQLTLFRVSGRNGNARANVNGENTILYLLRTYC